MYSQWLPVLGAFITGAFIITAPGLIITLALRQRGINALGLAPVLSIVSVALSAMIFPLLGMSWALYQPFLFALVIAGIGRALYAIAARYEWVDAFPVLGVRAPGNSDPADKQVDRGRWRSKGALLSYGAVLLGIVLLSRIIIHAIGDPQWYSQTMDVNFHANVIRYIADTGSASSLSIGGLTAGDNPPEFYPAAWHGVASLIYMYTGVSVAAAANTMSLLVGAFIWPISLVYLVRSVIRINTPALLSIGFVAAAYVSFPLLLIDFGVLYANSLGISLIPAVLGLSAQMLRLVQKRTIEMVPSIYLMFFACLGLVLAHPNILMTLLVCALPLILMRAYLQTRAFRAKEITRGEYITQLIVLALYPLTLNVLWNIVRPAEDAGPWDPAVTNGKAVGEALTNSYMTLSAQWIISILAVLGAIYLIKRRHIASWFVYSWAVAATFYVLVRSLAWELDRYYWVGVWYHDPYRLVANLPAFAAPLAVVGVHMITQWVRDTVATRYATAKNIGIIASVLSLLVAGVLGLQMQRSQPLVNHISYVYRLYDPQQEPDFNSPLLSVDEIDVLHHVAEYVPEDNVIINQPWNGSALAYAVSGRKVLTPHALFTHTKDRDTIDMKLNDARTEPEVCDAVKRNKAYYFLDFGRYEVNKADHVKTDFQGFKNIKYSGVVEPVYTKGQVGLYRVTACN